jgi:hypothetical protein
MTLATLTSSSPSESISPEQARGICVDAYLYFYPLVTMDITRKQCTNIEPGKEMGKGPMNVFLDPSISARRSEDVVRINSTRHSIAFDLTLEAQVVRCRTRADGFTCR